MTRIGLKVDLDVGDLVSHAGQAKSALDSITEAMRNAEAAGDYDTYGKLAYEKDRAQTRAAGYDRDLRTFANNPKVQGTGASGQPVFKIDQEYANLIKAQVDAIKRLTASYNAAIDRGDVDGAMSLSNQIAKEQAEFHKLVGKATGTGEGKKDGTAETVKGILLNQVVGAIKDALNITVNSTDRTAFINAAGSGDMLGASLAEKQRKSERTSGVLNLVGSGAQGIGGALAPFTGGVSLLAGTGINIVTSLLDAGNKLAAKKAANRTAYAGLWDSQKDQAMNLAAILGDPKEIRDMWKSAAASAEQFGYTVEEAGELAKASAQQGVTNTASEIFKYERSTGADRGALSSLANLSERYGNGDAIKAAWRGLNATGMKTGQFTEVLRGMQRVIEDGISKGYVRSSEQVARNLTMLAQITGNSPLWQGEQGIQRLTKLNNGIAGSVDMQSSTDVMAFRAARNALQKDPNSEFYNKENIPYWEVMKLVQNGFSGKHGTAFFNQFMQIINDIEGRDKGAKIERIVGKEFSYEEADRLVSGWRPGLDDAALDNLMNSREKALPDISDIRDLQYEVESMNVRNLIIKEGMDIYDKEMPKSIEESRKVLRETVGDGGHAPGQWIDEQRKIVETSFFGRGGIAASDSTAVRQFKSMVDNAKAAGGEQLDALKNAFNLLGNVKRAEDRKDWDRHDVLNTITNTGDSREFLAKLDELIRLNQRGLDAETIIEIVNKR
jgi:hypothetical protein